MNEFLQIGIHENALNEISVYPNPVSGRQIFIRDGHNSVLGAKLLSVCGETILACDTDAGKIELTGVQDGVYFLQLFTSEGMVVRKIILQQL